MRTRQLLRIVRELTKRWRARRRPRAAGEPLLCEALESRTMLTGTWSALSNPAPLATGTMLLLSDGTVMSEGADYSNQWYRLTPDSTGNYAKGTWSPMASMGVTREFFASNVLKDGRVFVQGGEYSNLTGDTNTGEIYNPVSNTWTAIPNFPNSEFGDDPTQLLPDGRVLAGYLKGPQTYIYDPTTNQWSFAANKLRGDSSGEETWLKLPDGSILTYEIYTQGATTAHAQRYIPASNTWKDAGTIPVLLSNAATVHDELGPAFLLPDGRAFYIGANGHTAYYNPPTNTWTAGPDVPDGLGADDEPGAMMPNGKILFAAETPFWNPPSRLFEFDPVAQTYTDVTPPGYDLSFRGFHYRMLVLPSGQVLFNNGTSKAELYTPSGGPNPSWKPTITDLADKGGGAFTLTGTLLNGISQGASFGDDAEMDTNYPIIRLSDFAGHVYYARTSNWSSTGVATGATPETVNFTMPPGLGTGVYQLSVIANGIASRPVIFAVGTSAVDNVIIEPETIQGSVDDVLFLNGKSTLIVPSTVASVYLFTEAGNDAVDVWGTAAGLPVTIDGGAGNDTIRLGPAWHYLDPIQGSVSIRGGGGSDGLVVYDQAQSAAVTYTLATVGTSSSLARSGAATVRFDSSVKSLTLDGGSGKDTYIVNGTQPGSATTLDSGASADTVDVRGFAGSLVVEGQNGADVVNLGNAGNVQALVGNLSIRNAGSFSTINADDSADTAARVVTLSTPLFKPGFGRITGLAPGLIEYKYSDTAHLIVTTGKGADTVDVLATGVVGGTTLSSGGGLDAVNVGQGYVQDIEGRLSIINPPSYSAINVDDSDDGTARNVWLDRTSPFIGEITGLAPAPIDYDFVDTDSLRITTGTAADTVYVHATGVLGNGTAANDTLITSAGGADTVHIGNAGSVQDIWGILNIDNPAAHDTTIYVDDSADQTARTGVVIGSIFHIDPTYPPDETEWFGRIYQLAPGNIQFEYADTAEVHVDFGLGNDVIGFESTEVPYDLTTNGGHDTFNIGYHGFVSGVEAPLTFTNPKSYDAINFLDTADATPRNVGLYDAGGGFGSISGLTPAVITYKYADTSSIHISSGSAADTYFVAAVGAPTTLDTGGDDVINVGTAAYGLSRILAPLTVNGQAGTDAIKVNDGGAAAGETFTLTSTGLTRSGAATISFGTVESMAIAAGSGNDTLSITSVPPATSVSFAGGAGSDTVAGMNVANTFNITGSNAGNLGPNLVFTSVENLKGNAQNDRFVFGDGAALSGTIDGGGGENTLDYAKYTTGVTVNLSTDTATATTGVSNIRDVLGGAGKDHLTGDAGNNILVGNGGADIIDGGAGRDLIIGGGGADTLTGGGDDDLLIGAVTVYDGQIAALQSIMATWAGNLAYNIRHGQLLTTLAGKIIDDAIADIMSGDTGQDWFIGKVPPDVITDLTAGEFVN